MNNVNEQIAAICDDGARSWLIIRGVRMPYAAPRDPKTNAPLNGRPGDMEPMDRFAYQVDGGTMWDAEIIPEGLRIIWNGAQQIKPRTYGKYDEEDAFRDEEFSPGKVVTWEQVRDANREYVRLSNSRLG